MELIARLERYATEYSSTIAFKNVYTEESITYFELKLLSDKIAKAILKYALPKQNPILVYGHKSTLMIASFIACVKAGHPYCPIDISMPTERIKDIIEISDSKLLINIDDSTIKCENILTADEIRSLPKERKLECVTSITNDDVFYIIFTSGSTGKPKGVQITANCLDNYLRWMESIAKRENFPAHPVFLNQAPFSFDLSVMDMYTALWIGGTIWSLDKRVQEDMRLMYEKFADSSLNVWVSTPSFINMCLMNNAFNDNLLPTINTFLFCGEVLSNNTVRELYKRFPDAKVINTYGPTESTVAVTDVVIIEEMVNSNLTLPVGYTKPGSEIYIMDNTYSYPGLAEGQKGEIIIAGNTVAKGYLNCLDLTNEKFFVINTPNGQLRAYKTGDIGWMKDGLLYYSGRMDFQLKINGYRIELEDIENNILKIDNIQACVVLPIEKNGTYKGLAAIITVTNIIDDEFEYSQTLRKKLMDRIPYYMVPKKYVYVNTMPNTNNGKVDRNALKQLI